MYAAILCLFSQLPVFFSEQNFTICAERSICVNSLSIVLLADWLAWDKQLFEDIKNSDRRFWKSRLCQTVFFINNNNETNPSTAFLSPSKNNHILLLFLYL